MALDIWKMIQKYLAVEVVHTLHEGNLNFASLANQCTTFCMEGTFMGFLTLFCVQMHRGTYQRM